MAEITVTETNQRRSAGVADVLKCAGFRADTMTGGMTARTQAELPTL